jgi:ribosome-binding protein aMBF1 (putative translation factor)
VRIHLDQKAAARVDTFIERLRTYRNRMQGQFMKKLTDDTFELRVKQSSYFEGAGIMKRHRHAEVVGQRARKSAGCRRTFARTLHQIDLALLVREMREGAGLTQAELAKKVDTTQSVIARLEDAEYTGHPLSMLECIAAACGVALKLHAQRKPHFEREVALV